MRQYIISLKKVGNNVLGLKGQLFLVGIVTAVAAIGIAFVILSVSSVRFSYSLTNLPLLLLNGQQIDLEGQFACVPTTGPDICINGFRDNDGRYYLFSNLQEILMANPNLDSNAGNTFAITGTFSYGSPDNLSYVIVAGQVKVTSLKLVNDNTQFVIP